MRRRSRSTHAWRLAMLGALAALWLTLSALLVVAGGAPETMLRTAFARHSRPDAFEHLNRISPLFWAAHSCLFLMAVAAARSRRPDVLTVLLIGPAFGVSINLLGEDWSDPNWFVIVAVCMISWGVGTVVGGSYWLMKPARRPAEPGAAANPNLDLLH